MPWGGRSRFNPIALLSSVVVLYVSLGRCGYLAQQTNRSDADNHQRRDDEPAEPRLRVSSADLTHPAEAIRLEDSARGVGWTATTWPIRASRASQTRRAAKHLCGNDGDEVGDSGTHEPASITLSQPKD